MSIRQGRRAGTARWADPVPNRAPIRSPIERQQAQILERAEAAAMWQERAGTLADRLAVAEEKLLALAAPAHSPVAADLTPDPAPLSSGVTRRPSAPPCTVDAARGDAG